ncbi:DUF6544 family protein [Nesterenkonia sp. DZ6]|uniref:DUF6544 family protein n=1 Tax=Nesterenkonia sp. DZ6 TaxID=2901229 RepID=UPI001F4C559E|nr:DUF6544 family protein [Nesterenkonia sp. DZ6]MCH8559276.1 hypothetical protein [Nesterenkonia sp. DZ6]
MARIHNRTLMVYGGLTLVVLVGASVIGLGRYTFERRINGQIDEVLESGAAVTFDPVCQEDLVGLPGPVQRWLRWSGVVGKPIPSTVRLQQEGELLVGDLGWLPFTAEEYYSTQPPAFVWKANTRIAPGLPVIGKDSYLDGRGALEMRVLGLVPVARDTGPEMDEGDLLRYLNEILWFPAGSLIPEITWDPIDDGAARATMSYGGVSGTATFFFDREGRPTNMIAERYDRDYGAVLPWSTPMNAYGEFDGVRVPTEGEAAYSRENGDFSYIRLTITDVNYDVPERY